MTRISVIIPTHNRKTLVQEAIRSVLAQTFADFELIVVDDGSTDGTTDILKNLSDRCRFFSIDNRGPAAARNAAIAKARGNFIAFLDSDDLWRPRKLEKQAEFMRDNTELQLCHTDEMWIRHGQQVTQRKHHRKEGGYIFPRALQLCIISPSAVMLRRSLIERISLPNGQLFDESFPACEDYDLWLRITSKYKVGFIDEPLTIKRGGLPDQLSAQIEALDRFRIRSIQNLLHRKTLSHDQARLAIAELKRKCKIYAAGCIKRHKIAEAQYYSNLPHTFPTSSNFGVRHQI